MWLLPPQPPRADWERTLGIGRQRLEHGKEEETSEEAGG